MAQYSTNAPKNISSPSTILFDPPVHDNDPDPSHPLFYYKNRTAYLEQLSDRYATQYRLPTLDLKRNAKVDYYMAKYTAVQNDIKKEEQKIKSFLRADEFQTIFTEDIDRRRQEERERKQRERLKKDLEGMWFEEQRVFEPPEKDSSENHHHKHQPQKAIHKVARQNQPQVYQQEQAQQELDFRPIFLAPQNLTETQKKERYLLDLQIGKIKFQTQQLPQRVHHKLNSCQNQQLLSKLSNNILSAYMVHFDEIYAKLIDELLEEEVYYLNYMEAEYKVEKDEWRRGYSSMQAQKGENKNGNKYDSYGAKMRYEDGRTLAMMELVKKLDELCDE